MSKFFFDFCEGCFGLSCCILFVGVFIVGVLVVVVILILCVKFIVVIFVEFCLVFEKGGGYSLLDYVKQYYKIIQI